MGNEQAVPQQNQSNQTGFQASGPSTISSSSSQNYLLSESSISKSITPDYKIVIVVRGTRKSGKTTLITRMRGFSFDPEYQATNSIEITEIPWRSPAQENILVAAWDTVEHCRHGIDTKASSGAIPLDATAVDTLEKADAVVIMIDNRSEESIDLAEKLIINARDDLPLVVFSNFMDLENSSPLIPIKLQQYMGRFFFIPGSLKTNQGIIELSKWLTLPLIAAKAKFAYSLHLAAQQESKDLELRFSKLTQDFTELSSALSHIQSIKKETSTSNHGSSATNSTEHGHTYKKAYQRRPIRRVQSSPAKENQQKAPQNTPQTRETNIKTEKSDDNFWDDDDTPNPKVIKRRVVKKNSSMAVSKSNDDIDDGILRPNPLVKPSKNLPNKIVNPAVTPTFSQNPPSQQEGETTRRRKVVKRKSSQNLTGAQQQTNVQTQQQSNVQTQQHSNVQTQQQSNVRTQRVVRRKKKVVHTQQQQPVVSDDSAEGPTSVDGYESF